MDEINGENPSPVLLRQIMEFFLRMNKTMCFNPYEEDNVIVRDDKSFEDLCNSMEDNGVSGAKEATVFEFYSKVQYLEKKILKLKSHAGKSL